MFTIRDNQIVESIVRTMFIMTKYRQQLSKMRKKVPAWVYDLMTLHVFDNVTGIINNILFKYAKEYRFFCEELESDFKDNKYRKLRCEQAKLKIRLSMKLVRSLIEYVKNYVKDCKVQYSYLLNSLTELEKLVTEFESNPASLSDVVQNIVEKERELNARLSRIEYMIDILLQFMEAYGIIYRKRTATGKEYFVCTHCSYKTLDKYDIVSHCTLHLKIEHDAQNSEEIDENE